MGKPEKTSLDKYDQIAVNQVTVWQSANIEAKAVGGSIEINLIQFLLFKNLSVKGARAKGFNDLPACTLKPPLNR